MTNKRLLKEIDQWYSEGLISQESSDVLKSRYSAGSKSTLAIIFSVIGSILIAAGIALLFAKNWFSLPLAVKTVLSLLPIVAGQGIALFTLIKRSDSLPWREGAAIFLTIALFASFALINQSYTLPIETDLYVLLCALLTLPVIYILDAVSPLVVYFGAVIGWGAMNHNSFYVASLVTLLMLAGIAYVIIHRKSSEPRRMFSVWVCAVAGAAYIGFLLSSALESNLNVIPIFTAYFLALYAFSSQQHDFSLPFKPLGAIASAASTVTAIIVSSYSYIPEDQTNSYNEYIALIFTITILMSAIVTAIIRKRKDILSLLYVIFCATSTLICCVFPNFLVSSVMPLFAAVAALAAGVCLTVKGAKESEMSTANLGLLMICAVIAMSFFSIETDILIKGFAFLILGTLFLIANIIMIKSKKARLISERTENI